MEEDEVKPKEEKVFSNISHTIINSSKAFSGKPGWVVEMSNTNSERSEKNNFLKERIIGVVHVVVVQAVNLKAMDKGISSDPYCKVSLGKEKHKTKTVNSCLSPKWKESMTLNWIDNGKNDQLRFSLYDNNFVRKNDYLGR